ncbi:hypothetical protein MB46_04495 [Arthrobacter alpinus]|nr:hypothetical protein MB46_04495 [Arthrobacter alpinus]
MEPIIPIDLPTTLAITTADLAAAGFLARYNGGTRNNCEVTLKLLWQWCGAKGVDVLTIRRPILELFARYLEDERKNSPATHIHMPKVYRDESRTLGLDRLELSALIQTAMASHVMDGGLITLLGMLGLRVSEACAVLIEDFQDTERGHRVLRLVGKGGRPATIPPPVAVLRALDAAAGERHSGPLLLRRTSTMPMNRKAATLAVARLSKKAGIT